MFGIVIKKEINKMGFPYAIIKGTNGITYYCDDRGMENEKVEDLVVGESVEYVSFKDNKGKIIATHLKRSKKTIAKKSNVKKIGQIALAIEEKERIKRIIVNHIKETGLDNFMPTNGTPIVLMGIYKKKNDLIRVLYLYAIYYHLTKTGNRTFYAQLHKSDARISSMDSHYKAIRMAFTKYTYNDLIAFLDWASRIIIDGRYTSRFEICKTEIDRLIKNPQVKQNWEAIISKLAKDNIRQINSAFGYAIQCVYLLNFYNLDEESDRQVAEASIDQLTRFASFSKISETTNFISLNIKMIDVMPETYVIKFAEFFARNSSISEDGVLNIIGLSEED